MTSGIGYRGLGGSSRATFISEFRGHAEYYRGQPQESEPSCPSPANRISFSYRRSVRSSEPARRTPARRTASGGCEVPRSGVQAVRHRGGAVVQGPATRHPAPAPLDGVRGKAKRPQEGIQIYGDRRADRRAQFRSGAPVCVSSFPWPSATPEGPESPPRRGRVEPARSASGGAAGDRPAFIAALRWIWGQVGGRPTWFSMRKTRSYACSRAALAAQVVLDAVCRECGFVGIDPPALPKACRYRAPSAAPAPSPTTWACRA